MLKKLGGRVKEITALVLVVTLLTVLGFSFLPGVTVTMEGDLFVGLSSARASIVTTGTGEELSQQAIEAVARKGGVPVVSISYKDGIHIDFSGSYPDLDFTTAQIQKWVKNKTVAEAEQIINDRAQAYLEIWEDMSSFPPEDPAMQEPPILLSNERMEKSQGRDWLVSTGAYFAIHLYNLNFGEGDFITRINSIKAGPPVGDWWN